MVPCNDCNYGDGHGECLAKLTPKDQECDHFELFEPQIEMDFDDAD